MACGNSTAQFNVIITDSGTPDDSEPYEDPYILSVSDVTPPAKTSYIEGEIFDPTGMKFNTVWMVNGKEVIADEVNFDLSRDDVERANRLHRLYQAIERLSEQSRKVVKLICLNNYSYADAASELGVSLATIKTHMYRSIKALRKFMALFIF